MQTVRQGDTLWSYWRALDEETKEPVDLSGSTVVATVQMMRNGKLVGNPIVLDAEISEADEGRWRHRYSALTPGVYALTAAFDGPPGLGTAPTRQNALLNVIPKL